MVFQRLTVTNADGTTSVKTLAQAGSTSTNLVPTDTDVQQVDGSVETDQTTYTKTDGSTGTVADVTLETDANDYAVQQTVTHNADEFSTVYKAYDASCDLASATKSTVLADRLSQTLTMDNNGDGVVDGKQTEVVVTNADGCSTETLIDRSEGGASGKSPSLHPALRRRLGFQRLRQKTMISPRVI